MHWLRNLLNAVRNILLFRIRYPWVIFGEDVHVQWSTHIWSPHKLVRLGNHVGIGGHSVISADVIIGNHVLIAGSASLLSRDAHTSLPGVTMFDSPRGDRFQVVIQDDVWIGHGAIILSGVTVGRGSIIGAGSIITKDVPPYSIIVPQRSEVIRRRFTDSEIEVHEASLRRQGVISDGDSGTFK